MGRRPSTEKISFTKGNVYPLTPVPGSLNSGQRETELSKAPNTTKREPAEANPSSLTDQVLKEFISRVREDGSLPPSLAEAIDNLAKAGRLSDHSTILKEIARSVEKQNATP